MRRICSILIAIIERKREHVTYNIAGRIKSDTGNILLDYSFYIFLKKIYNIVVTEGDARNNNNNKKLFTKGLILLTNLAG